MKFYKPRTGKLVRSAGIVLVAAGILLLLKQMFPEFDFSGTQGVMLTAITAWLVNTVRETTREG